MLVEGCPNFPRPRRSGRQAMNKLVLAVLVLMAAATQATAQQQQKPNVVFILADNVGYGDMGPYGGGKLRGMPTPVPTSWPARVAPDAIPGGTLLHAVARRADDRAVLDPRSGCRLLPYREHAEHSAGQCLHDGATVQGRGLCDGDVRQMAPRDRGPRACRARTASTSSTASRRTPRGTMRQPYRRSFRHTLSATSPKRT